MVRRAVIVAVVACLVGLAGPAAAQTAAPTKESPDQWRASKLVGVPVYGPGTTSVGKISDLLMGKDGRVQAVVIGIGGLLGLGQKDVALPYDQVQFSDQPITPQPAATAPSAPNETKADNGTAGGVTPSAREALTGGDKPIAPIASDVLGAPSHSAAYPDHGTIALTTEQLRNVPAFEYAQ